MKSDRTGAEPTHPPVKLNVLPSSGKVDQLRKDLMLDGDHRLDRNSQGDAARPAAATESAMGSAPAEPATGSAQLLDSVGRKLLEGKIIQAISSIYDPEIPVNIYELGLIYEINIDDTRAVRVKMTLTAPACPVAGSLPGEVEKKIESVPEVRSADVELVWDPPWDRSRMSEAAMLTLGI